MFSHSFTCHASPPLSLTVKDFKAVSGQKKHMGSLDGVTTVEKEKFPKHFWPDVRNLTPNNTTPQKHETQCYVFSKNASGQSEKVRGVGATTQRL